MAIAPAKSLKAWKNGIGSSFPILWGKADPPALPPS
jgi:hypothetical protein